MTAAEILKQQKFELREEVQYANKMGNDKGVVIGIVISPYDLFYKVAWSSKQELNHYDFELKKIGEK